MEKTLAPLGDDLGGQGQATRYRLARLHRRGGPDAGGRARELDAKHNPQEFARTLDASGKGKKTNNYPAAKK